jgi:hypothetical protein
MISLSLNTLIKTKIYEYIYIKMQVLTTQIDNRYRIIADKAFINNLDKRIYELVIDYFQIIRN